MLRQRLHRKPRTTNCHQRQKCPILSATSISIEKPLQQLQELKIGNCEPILLRCSPLQNSYCIQINALQRTSEIYKVFHEFHTAVTQSMFCLVPSLETDELPVRYVFASISGRSTCVQLRSSSIYKAHWHAISSNEEIEVIRKIQIMRRTVVRLSSEIILRPMEMKTAERWHVNWEYVIYRVSHGLHFAIMESITDMNPQQTVVFIRIQKAYPRRFIRSIVAPVQKKKILKASEPYLIKMCTVDRSEPCHVKKIITH